MNAEIIAVGSEMLTPQRVDTNSLFLTEHLNGLGVEVVLKTIVGDDRARLTSVITAALSRSNIILLSGGLGPTEDDVTRDAVAAALGRSQHFDQAVCDWIAERFARMNRPMAENNKRQAMIIEGAEILPNDRGTAPGLWIHAQPGGLPVIVLLPGPPHELKAMFTKQCLSRLEKLVPPLVIRTRFYRVAGMGESDLDQLIAPVYTKYENPATTILAAPGDIQIHLRARCPAEAEAEKLLAEVGGPIEELLGDRIYSRNGDSLEAALGAMMRLRQVTVSVAESVTGGMLAERITSVPGSSDYFLGGFLTYRDDVKTALLGVDAELLKQHTAVSEPVAMAMAAGAKQRTGSNFAISVTGVAGPDGGTEANPVGTVYIGIADEAKTTARRLNFFGDRTRVRALACTIALDMLRRRLL